MKPALLLSFFGLAAAAPPSSGLNRREETAKDDATRRVLIGAAGKILAGDFMPGCKFEVKASVAPRDDNKGWFSWMVFDDQKNVVHAVDELENKVYVLDYNPKGNIDQMLTLRPDGMEEGSNGVVHLEYTHDRKRMLGSSYATGGIDVWDTSAKNGDISLLKTIPKYSEASKAHQAVRHPTKNLFVVNDLGADMLLVVEADTESYDVVNKQPVPSGCGPRHGVFSSQAKSSQEPTHYTVLCETSRKLITYEIAGNGGHMTLTQTDIVPILSGKNEVNETEASGAELVVSGRFLYASVRSTGNTVDIVSWFEAKDGKLYPKDPEYFTRAKGPRMISLSTDQTVLFVANQEHSKGLHTFPRNKNDGTLDGTKATYADLSDYLSDEKETPDEQTGPMFVTEIKIT